MKEVTTQQEAAELPDGLRHIVTDVLEAIRANFAEAGAEWDPDSDGSLFVIEEGDDFGDLGEAGLSRETGGLLGALWDGVSWHPDPQPGAWMVFVGISNAGGPSFVVPNEAWVPQELRERLEEEAQGQAQQPKAESLT